jgi:hypothetical protein
MLDAGAADLLRDLDIPNAVLTTCLISFEHVRQHSLATLDLLSLMSVLDNNSIPLSPLHIDNNADNLDLTDNLDPTDDIELTDAMAPLFGFAMIAYVSQPTAVCMHRLVQLAMRKWLESNGRLSHWKQRGIQRLPERYPDYNHEHMGLYW